MARILVVDDQKPIRMLLCQICIQAGHIIAGEADNGAQAVIKYFDLMPDVVTMDIAMPQLDGISALKQIRASDPKARIIICSAVVQETVVKESLINGAVDYIVKPFDIEMVRNALKKALAMK